MSLLTSYRKISSKLFNKFSERHMRSFSALHHELRKANVGIMCRDYLSMCFFTLIFSLLLGFPIMLVITYLLGLSMVYMLFWSVIMAVVAALLAFIFALKFPVLKAHDRERNIDNNLPFATLYMNTIAGTGAPPYIIFKLLSNFKEYGEVSKEAQEIVENIEVLGQDIEVALQRAADESPSEDFKDLLWAMITTIVRGGDLRSLLQEKSDTLLESYRRKIRDYANDLAMYVEVYITLVIVGSIFGIVMSSIMGTISGFAGLRAIQEVMVYVFLPMAATVFILILKLTSPID